MKLEIWNFHIGLTCLLSIVVVACAAPEVRTTSGIIRGKEMKVFGKTIDAYLGIPFAKPPVGSLRFKRPVPINRWSGVLNVTTWPGTCHQMPFEYFKNTIGERGEETWNPKTNMTEDCLYLNIWAPRDGRKLSTMVWIFGGGFVTGTSYLKLYEGQSLAAYSDVIVASFSYRVGPLGFLYLGNEFAPGNMGLLDQNLALKWIYDNIVYFGGMSSSITLFGESAGAASVSYHLMSKMSRDYFQRAIMQSGTALGHWSHVEPEVALKYAKETAKLVNCTNDATLHSCLLKADAQKLSVKQWDTKITYLTFPFVPTTDNYFITESPKEFVERGRFPSKSMLMGVNKNEAVYFLNYYMKEVIQYPLNILNRKSFVSHIASTVASNGYEISRYPAVLRDAILHEYDSRLPGEVRDYYNVLDNIGGDLSFKCPVIKFAQAFNAEQRDMSSKVYMYSFEHRTSSNPWPPWSGVLHGDEIEYIFGVPVIKSSDQQYSRTEKELSYSMIQYWSNFAKTGDPMTGYGLNSHTTWPPYTYENEEYLVLKAGQILEVKTGLRHKECAFWMDYYPKLKSAIENSPLNETCVSLATTTTPSSIILLTMTSFLTLFQLQR